MKRLQFLSLLLALLSIGVVSEAQYFRVQRLTLVATPTNDDTQTQVLVRNSTSGQVQYRAASTLLGTTDLAYTASTRLLASSTGADVTLPLFTSTDAGLVPLSGGGTVNFLRADGTWAAPASSVTLAHGTYTPTITGESNVASTVSLQGQYMRVGNTVTVSGSLRVTPTAINTFTQLRITLPVSSNFSGAINCAGVFNGTLAATSNAITGRIEADFTNDNARFLFYATDTNQREFYFTFTYLVL